MNKYILTLIILLSTGCAHTPYYKIGVDLKIHETTVYWEDGSVNHPIGARLEVGQKFKIWGGDVRYGIGHSSQWFKGPPINNDLEYSRTGFFLDWESEINF